MKLQTRLVILLSLLALMPLLIMSYLGYLNQRAALLHSTTSQLVSLADVQERRVLEVVDRYLEEVALVSSRTQLRRSLDVVNETGDDSERSRITNIIRDARAASSAIIDITVMDLNGSVVASTRDSYIGEQWETEEFFSLGKRDRAVHDIIKDEHNILRVVLVGPLVLDDELVGVIHIISDAKTILDVTQNHPALVETGETILAKRNKAGDALFLTPLRFNEGAALRLAIPVEKSHIPISPAVLGEEKIMTEEGVVDYRGEEVFAVTRFIDPLGWGLVIKIDRKEALAPVVELRNSYASITVLSIMLVITITYITTRSLIAPIRQLTLFAQNLQSRNFNMRTQIQSHDEIGFLAKTMNEMADILQGLYKDLEDKVEERTRQLATANARNEAMLLSVGDGLIATGKDGNIVLANKAAEEMLGFKEEELQGKKLPMVIPLLNEYGEPVAGEDRLISRALRERTITSTEATSVRYYQRKDGSQFPVFITVSPVVSNDELIGAVEVFRDVTHEFEHRKELEKFQLALQEASDHIVITDPNGIIVFANAAAEKLTGYSKEEMIGRKAGDHLWGLQMSKSYYKQLWKTIKTEKKAFRGEVQNKNKSGDIYDAQISITPILNEKGDVEFFVGIERDITKEKQIDRAKTEFVSLASHQLRTPLSTIGWYAEMLLDGDAGDLNEKQKEYLREVYIGNQRMVTLVNSLLDVSRIELGTFTIEPEMTSLATLARKVVAEVRPLAKENKVKLTAEFAKELPKVNVDPKLMWMIVENLLSNAIKYTPEKGTVTCHIDENAKGQTCGNMKLRKDSICITVQDTGFGIPKAQQDKIFSKLFRADNAKESDTQGTGLGLYIVKSVIEQSGGQITFESVENEGTSFYVALPLTGMKKKTGTKSLG